MATSAELLEACLKQVEDAEAGVAHPKCRTKRGTLKPPSSLEAKVKLAEAKARAKAKSALTALTQVMRGSAALAPRVLSVSKPKASLRVETATLAAAPLTPPRALRSMLPRAKVMPKGVLKHDPYSDPPRGEYMDRNPLAEAEIDELDAFEDDKDVMVDVGEWIDGMRSPDPVAEVPAQEEQESDVEVVPAQEESDVEEVPAQEEAESDVEVPAQEASRSSKWRKPRKDWREPSHSSSWRDPSHSSKWREPRGHAIGARQSSGLAIGARAPPPIPKWEEPKDDKIKKKSERGTKTRAGRKVQEHRAALASSPDVALAVARMMRAGRVQESDRKMMLQAFGQPAITAMLAAAGHE
jgi:hypothetical protein